MLNKSVLICCLGNPGPKYELTRHNMGFLMADAIIDHFSLIKTSDKKGALLFEGGKAQQKIRLIKPQGYMNVSGESFQRYMAFYKLDPAEAFVIYDDYELPFGALRFRKKGSAGTHNGMKSILQMVGNPSIPRLRIGIGPKPEHITTTEFVLGQLSKKECLDIASIQDHVCKGLDMYLFQDQEKGMLYFNSIV